MAEQPTYPFLPEDKCLTEQQLFDYIDGKMSAPDMHAAEKHMLDCAMCSDALEGFEKIKNRGKVAGISPLSKTEKNSENKSGKTSEADSDPKIIPLRPNNKRSFYAIAAALVLIFGITVVLKMSLSENDASKKTAENQSMDFNPEKNTSKVNPPDRTMSDSTRSVSPSELSPKTNDVTVAPSATKKVPAAGPGAGADRPVYFNRDGESSDSETPTNLASEDQNHSTNGATTLNQQTTTPPPVALYDDIATDKSEADKKADGKVAAKDEVVTDSNSGYVNTTDDSKNEQEEKSGVFKTNRAEKAKADAQPVFSAPAANNAGVASGGTFSTSQNNLDSASTIPAQPKTVAENGKDADTNSDYENGVNLLNANKAAQAITYFDEVLKNTSDIHFEDAQWKKALALIQLNKKEEAKTLLNEIVQKKGKYQKDAEAKLKTL